MAITSDIGKTIRSHRVTIPLTLQELSSQSGVSSSHLGRIERGERFPSATVLKKIAQPLNFDERGLMVKAGYLTAPQTRLKKLPKKEGTGCWVAPWSNGQFGKVMAEFEHEADAELFITAKEK